MEPSLSRKKSGRDPRKGDGKESSTVPGLTIPKDILFDPLDSSCRRRMEWPTGDQSTWQMIQGEPASEQVPQSAKALVDGELSKCDASTGFVPDIQVLDQLYVHHPKYRSLLRNLYWRARRQSAIWHVFKLLLHRQYIDPICLHLPIDFDQCSASDTIVNLLEGFSFLTHDIDEMLDQNIPLQSAQWDKDLKWWASYIPLPLWTNFSNMDFPLGLQLW